MKRVIITGGTGFVGANLVRRLLHDGHEVHLLVRPGYTWWRIESIQSDLHLHEVILGDEAGLTKVVGRIQPDWVFHLAVYGAYSSQTDLHQMIQTNINGLINLLKACTKSGFESFINTGSSSEYGSKYRPMSEDDLLEPNTYYGITKAAQTLFCQHWAREKTVPIVTLRLFSPYGYYEEPDRFIPTLINSCLGGKDLSLVSSETARDFIFIDDVVDSYLIATSRVTDLSDQIINIGGGEQHTIKEVVSLALKITNTKVSAKWGAMPDRSFDTDIWQADISRAKRLLKWQPKFNLEGGLRKTVDWFKENRNEFNKKYALG